MFNRAVNALRQGIVTPRKSRKDDTDRSPHNDVVDDDDDVASVHSASSSTSSSAAASVFPTSISMLLMDHEGKKTTR